MIVSLHAWGKGRNEPQEIPDEPVREFAEWLLQSTVWKAQPRLLYNRALKLRKKLLEQAKVVESAIDLEKFPASDARPKQKAARK
jgi:hypothetical protein